MCSPIATPGPKQNLLILVDGGQWDPMGAHWAPLGTRGAPWAPNPLLWVADKIRNRHRKSTFGDFWVQNKQKKVGIQAPGPPRRDPGRNSEPHAGFKVPNGGMATHLVAKRCDLGSLEVLGPASTPEPPHSNPPFILHKPPELVGSIQNHSVQVSAQTEP